MRKYTTAMKMTKLMTEEMSEPKSTSVLGLLARICTPSPTLPPWKLCTSGLTMSFVNAVTRPLNARATTSPTATTITSPRIRKFLKPLIHPSLARETAWPGAAPSRHPRMPAGTPLPLRLRLRTSHTIPVRVWLRKRFRRVACRLTCGSAGKRGCGPGRVGGGGELPVSPGDAHGPGVITQLAVPGTADQPGAHELPRPRPGQAERRGEHLVPGVVPEDHDALGPQPVARAAAVADAFHIVVLHGHRGHHGAADPHPLRAPEQLVHPLLARRQREDRRHVPFGQPEQRVFLQRGAGVQPLHRGPAAVVEGALAVPVHGGAQLPRRGADQARRPGALLVAGLDQEQQLAVGLGRDHP